MSSRPHQPPRSDLRRRICLAASGGGHVRQLLDLEPVWSKHDYFFVTEDTALGRTLSEQHPTRFLPHFAWGQAKQGAVFRMLGRAFRSFFRSAAIMLRERPEVVISTGAGAVFPIVLWGRLVGAKVIVVESFARFEKPSLFGRIAAPFAHHMVVQSAKLAAVYPQASVFDPLRILDKPPPPKEPLLFATVGATLPFDRLVRSIAQLKAEGAIPERVVVQTGVGGEAPQGLETYETLPFDEVQALLKRASIVVCHGGTGSLITALREGCQVIALPRLSRLAEHYDDHQSEITEAFVQRGLIQSATDVEELRAALAAARTRAPVLATTDPVALIDFLRRTLEPTPRSLSEATVSRTA
jgi:UDP-N-acetylglucosamine transferase subunit ALG13